MTRDEHLAWAKERALAELDGAGGPAGAVGSMTSDLGKHPETAGHPALLLGGMLLLGGHLNAPRQARDWIEGFR